MNQSAVVPSCIRDVSKNMLKSGFLQVLFRPLFPNYEGLRKPEVNLMKMSAEVGNVLVQTPLSYSWFKARHEIQEVCSAALKWIC